MIIYPTDETGNRAGIEENINSRYNIYLTPNTTYKVEDYPLEWIDGTYYSTYKDNIFEVPSIENVKSEADYAAVTDINLSSQSLTTDFTSELLSKFSNLDLILVISNNITVYEPSLNLKLTRSFCSNNSISEIDFSNNILLTYISCEYNVITNLNLANLDKVTFINARNNQLESIDISDCVSLESLNILLNPLTSLNVQGLTKLVYLNTNACRLSNIENSQILIDLDLNAAINGTFISYIFGGGSLTTAGQTAKANLQAKGWTIVGI